jgi:hypothetical protein
LWVNYGAGSDYQTAVAAQDNPYFDFLLYDLEHQPYDLGQLKRFLVCLRMVANSTSG